MFSSKEPQSLHASQQEVSFFSPGFVDELCSTHFSTLSWAHGQAVLVRASRDQGRGVKEHV